MRNTHSAVADDFDRLLPANGRQGKTTGLLDRAFEGVCRERIVGLAQRLAEHKHRGNQHIASLAHAAGELGVCVQRDLGVCNHLAELLIEPTLGSRRVGRWAQRLLDLSDEHQTTVGLRLKKENGVRNRFGFGRTQLVNQLCVHIARPRPAPNIGNALVVNGNDGNPIRWLARRTGAGKVVVTTLQSGKKISGTV